MWKRMYTYLDVAGLSNSQHNQRHNSNGQQHRNFLVLSFVLMIFVFSGAQFCAHDCVLFWC